MTGVQTCALPISVPCRFTDPDEIRTPPHWQTKPNEPSGFVNDFSGEFRLPALAGAGGAFIFVSHAPTVDLAREGFNRGCAQNAPGRAG